LRVKKPPNAVAWFATRFCRIPARNAAATIQSKLRRSRL
jgi:hypothetical protein